MKTIYAEPERGYKNVHIKSTGFLKDFRSSLQPEDIPTIVLEWSYKWSEAQAGLESLVTKLPSVAIRRNQAKNDSAPVHSTGYTLVAYT